MFNMQWLCCCQGYFYKSRYRFPGNASATNCNSSCSNAAAMALLLTPMVPVLWAQGSFAVASVPAWSAIAYLAVVVTILGYVLWYWALGQGGIARVGLIQFLQPVSGVILAAALLGERISASFLLASALVLGGVWLAIRGK